MAKPLRAKSPLRAARAGASRPALPPAPAPAIAPAAPSTPAPLGLPQPGGWWSAAALIFSFFLPEIGLVLALLYLRQSEPRARNFGRWCLLLSLLGWLSSVLTGALRSALGNGDWYVQPFY